MAITQELIDGWRGKRPAPLEYFHGQLMDAFHEFRRAKVGQETVEVSINGSDLAEIIATAKKRTYAFYEDLDLDKSIPDSPDGKYSKHLDELAKDNGLLQKH